MGNNNICYLKKNNQSLKTKKPMSEESHLESRPEIRIRGVSENMPQQLYNIARNSGYDTRNDFLKVKLREIVNQAPDHLKREPT